MRASLSLALALFLLAACKAGPEYSSPSAPASKALASSRFLRAEQAETAAPLARWWEGMGDAELTRLIEQGLRQAPGIAASEARLRQSRAGLAATKADAMPSAGTSMLYAHAELPEGSLSGSSGNIDLFNAGFDAQWEADIWGGKRRDAERASAEADAAAAKLADVQVALSAEIARTYVALRARQARGALLGERLALHQRLVAIARQRHAGGTVARQSVEAALARAERGEAELAANRAEIAALTDSLAVLSGQAPGEVEVAATGAIPLPPVRVDIGDPALMLARRPDIRAAERQLAAASAAIGVEQARRFPSLSFMGLIGIGGTDPGDLFDTANISTIALPRLTWSFLDFGRGAARVRGAEAGRDAALADYHGAVLAALQDAEGSLARYGGTRVALARSGSAANHAREVARLEALRARAGTLAPVAALESDVSAVEARLGESSARSDLTLAYIAVAKALGLGWEQAGD